MQTEPEPDTTPTEPVATDAPRRLLRSRRQRVLGGVCGGLGEYLGVDPVLVRIGAIALLLAGGAGAVLYVAALLLMPEDPGEGPLPARDDRGRAVMVALAVVAALVLAPLVLPPVFVAGAILIPLAVLLLVGLGVWWLVSGQGAGGSAGQVLKRGALGVAVLLGLGLLAAGGALAAGAGGGGVAAGLVIGAGVLLVGAAFARRARWAVLPVLAMALPAAFVMAAGIDLRGGIGERQYSPVSAAELREGYRLGMGRMVIDLRNTPLPPGDTPLDLSLGVGGAMVLVDEGVCVATRSRIGMGGVLVFDRGDGGVDVQQRSEPPASPNVSRLVLSSDIGVGGLHVAHDEREARRLGPRRFDEDGRSDDDGRFDDERFGDERELDDEDEAEDVGNRACAAPAPPPPNAGGTPAA